MSALKNLMGSVLQKMLGSTNTLSLFADGFNIYKKSTPTRDFMEDVAVSWLSFNDTDFGNPETFLAILDIAYDPRGLSFFSDLRGAILKDNWHKQTLDEIMDFVQRLPKPSVENPKYTSWHQAASDLSNGIVSTKYDNKPVFAIEAQSDICDAAEEGDLIKVQQLVESGTDINEAGYMNMTALMAAVKGRQLDVLRFLLQHSDIDPTALNSGGTTALSIACRQNWLDGVNALLSHPSVDVNQVGEYGGTALHQAAGMGHTTIVQRLLQEPNIKIQATYTDKKHTPISIARQNGHSHVAFMIEKHSAVQPVSKQSPKMK